MKTETVGELEQANAELQAENQRMQNQVAALLKGRCGANCSALSCVRGPFGQRCSVPSYDGEGCHLLWLEVSNGAHSERDAVPKVQHGSAHIMHFGF